MVGSVEVLDDVEEADGVDKDVGPPHNTATLVLCEPPAEDGRAHANSWCGSRMVARSPLARKGERRSVLPTSSSAPLLDTGSHAASQRSGVVNHSETVGTRASTHDETPASAMGRQALGPSDLSGGRARMLDPGAACRKNVRSINELHGTSDLSADDIYAKLKDACEKNAWTSTSDVQTCRAALLSDLQQVLNGGQMSETHSQLHTQMTALVNRADTELNSIAIRTYWSAVATAMREVENAVGAVEVRCDFESILLARQQVDLVAQMYDRLSEKMVLLVHELDAAGVCWMGKVGEAGETGDAGTAGGGSSQE